MFVKDGCLTIYFGDKSDPFFPLQVDLIHCMCREACSEFDALRVALDAQSIVFLKQVHGTDSYYIPKDQSKACEIHEREGDALITDQPGCAIGVLTADCVPIVLYDQKHHAIAAIHAGWRGTVALIATKTLQSMIDRFGSELRDIKVYVGPSARSCCYEVGDDFIQSLDDFFQGFLVMKNEKAFFDGVQANCALLREMGVLDENISTKHAACTMCDLSYHSYRRDQAGRQATVAVLRPRET